MKALWIVLLGTIFSSTWTLTSAKWPVTSSDESIVVLGPEPKRSSRQTRSVEYGEDEDFPKPNILSLHVNTTIQYRFAHSVVISKIANPAKHGQEVQFSVVLPENAFIATFIMSVDGKEYKSFVKSKEAAEQIYGTASITGQSAAKVAVSARDSKQLTVSVYVEAYKNISFLLAYDELLGRSLGSYRNAIFVSPGQLVQDMELRVYIKESTPFTNLETPGFMTETEMDKNAKQPTNKNQVMCKSDNPFITLKCISAKEAEIIFSPSKEQQEQIIDELYRKMKEDLDEKHERSSMDLFGALGSNKDQGLNGYFIVKYDVDHMPNGGEVLVYEGYFVHYFAPPNMTSLPKHAIFILDTSGSMNNIRIKQLKQAMSVILGELQPHDYFNIIQFESSIKFWDLSGKYWTFDSDSRPMTDRLAFRATEENIEIANRTIQAMDADGGTNIIDALHVGLNCAKYCVRPEAPKPTILFLTDGEAATKETNTEVITKFITEYNSDTKFAIFSLGFGQGANITFLRELSQENNGFARTIHETGDAKSQLENFYRSIASRELENVTFKYPTDVVDPDSLTKWAFSTHFGGSEIVVSGKIIKDNVDKIDASVVGQLGDKVVEYHPQSYVAENVISPTSSEPTASKKGPTLVEKVWAHLKIEQLFEEIKKTKSDNTTKEEVPQRSKYEEELMKIATQYSMVTPLTSLVVVKPYETKTIETKDVSPDAHHDLPTVQLASESKSDHYKQVSIPKNVPRPTLPPSDNYFLKKNHFDGGAFQVAMSKFDYPPPPIPVLYPHALDEVKWLGLSWMGDASWRPNRVRLNLGPNDSTEVYLLTWYAVSADTTRITRFLMTNKTILVVEPQPRQSCTTNTTVPMQGECAYLANCVLPEIKDDIEEFKKYQCKIGRTNYLAICCP